MPSFQKLWEDSQKFKQGHDFWDRPSEDNEGSSSEEEDMILRGLELRPDRSDGQTFWDDFIDLMSQNSSEAAELLGITSDVISRWPQKIRKIVEKVRKQNDGERKKQTATGED